MVTNKVCSHCGEDKPAEKFYKNKDKSDGLTHNCIICRGKYQETYYEENDIERREYQSRYESKEEVKERKREWVRNKKKNDPEFKMRYVARSRINQSLKAGEHKTASSRQLLGCSIPYWMVYLEKQFTGEMTWDNHGDVWHIDHIRPIASFDVSNAWEQIQAFNYRNTQPLTVEENLSKGDSWDGDPEEWKLSLDH